MNPILYNKNQKKESVHGNIEIIVFS